MGTTTQNVNRVNITSDEYDELESYFEEGKVVYNRCLQNGGPDFICGAMSADEVGKKTLRRVKELADKYGFDMQRAQGLDDKTRTLILKPDGEETLP